MSKEFVDTMSDWCSRDEWQFALPPAPWLFFFTAGRALGRREMKGEAVTAAKHLIHRARRHRDIIILEDIYDAIEAIPEEVGEEFGKPEQAGGCEWIIGWNNEATVTGCGNEFYDWHGNTDFKFCSYCGKTIRVSGGDNATAGA